MKKIFTLLVCAFAFTMAMGQPTATIKKATTAPVVDGTVDDIWSTVDPIAIETPQGTETPTTGNSWWKMLWDDQGIYLLTFIDDDKFVPAYKGTVPGETWNYDKLEIYFDCNYEKKDAIGPMTSGSGHYQIAPTVVEALLEGGPTTEDAGDIFAYNVTDDPKYYVEYFFPFTMLNDKMGNRVDATEPIGFDVNIMDNDKDDLTPSRNRMNWANAGAVGENWSNMDDAGLIILDGATPGIDISSLSIAGGNEITEDNGTLQLTATVAPADATQPYKWVLTNGTGMATITTTGLVTAQRNGTVTVQAYSADDFVSSNEITLNITGQRISLEEIDIIKNSDFIKGTNGTDDWGRNPAESWIVEDGWMNVACTPKANVWDVMMYQAVNVDATTKYIIKFKAKASTNMNVPFITEDIKHDYKKDVVSSSPYREAAQWTIPVTTEAQWFEFDVTHTSFVEGSVYQLGFQVGMLEGTLSVDSVLMYKEADFALVDPKAGAKTIDANSIKVYPNPVGNATQITVQLVNAKGNVAVFNSVGQKIMEKSATTNNVRFDVSGLQKGLYFVKTSDGATQKFIR